MDEIEIWNSAYQLMRLYQHGAERAAADRADAKLELGDVNGFRAWKRVAWTIRDLEHKKPNVIEPFEPVGTDAVEPSAQVHRPPMPQEYPLQILLTEHVLWCCGERDSMAREFAKYKEKLFSARQCKDGTALTQGVATHLAYLGSAIQHLDKFIAGSVAPDRQEESRPNASESMHRSLLTSRDNSIAPSPITEPT